MTARKAPSPYEKSLLALRERYKEAVERTQFYDAKWNRINDELNEMLTREGVRRQEAGEWEMTDLDRVGRKNESLALKDALNAGNWWRQKALYLSLVIQTEIMLHQELLRLRDGGS